MQRHKLAIHISLSSILLMVLMMPNQESLGAKSNNASNSTRETFREPPVWTSEGGQLQRDLEIRRTKTKLGHRKIMTLTYDGSVPGPTWKLQPGDHIKVRLINNITPSASANLKEAAFISSSHASHIKPLPPDQAKAQLLKMTGGGMIPLESVTSQNSNIHTHGLQVSPKGNSDNVLVDISPGEFFDYDIPIPADQPAGLYFYHPHRHMEATRQFWNGLGGAIIIEGGLDNVPEVKAAKERLMVINELILDEFGQVAGGTNVPTAGAVPFSPVPATPSQIYFPVNGLIQPILKIHPGETQRWRIVNGGAHRTLELALEYRRTHELTPLHQIAQDGINFPVSKERKTIVLAPGNRVEIMVQGGPPGRYQLKSLAYDQGHPGGPRPEVLLATLISKGRKVSESTSFPLPLIPTQMPDISQNNIAMKRTVEWSGNLMSAPIIFEIDGKTFDAARIDQHIPVGTTEEWTLVNKDVYRHPFHIHVNPFQVIKVNGVDYAEPDVWWDTFALPPKGSVTLRIRFRPDVTGKTVFHCHILPHEDLGMMQLIDLVSTGDSVVKPNGPFPTGAPVPSPGKPPYKQLSGRPYVLTHLYPSIASALGSTSAKVPLGRSVEIQLPSDPTEWTPSIDGKGIRAKRLSRVYPSVGQYDGENAIEAFKFKSVKKGCTTLTMLASPTPPTWLGNSTEITFATGNKKFLKKHGDCTLP